MENSSIFPESFVILRGHLNFPSLSAYSKLSLKEANGDYWAIYLDKDGSEFKLDVPAYHSLMSGGIEIEKDGKKIKAVLFDDPICPGHCLHIHLQDSTEKIFLGKIKEVKTLPQESKCLIENEEGEIFYISYLSESE